MKQDIFAMVNLKETLEQEFHKKVDLVANHKHIKPFLLQTINKEIIYINK